MKQRPGEVAALIRRVIDGVGVPSSLRQLACIGGPAVEPILHAMVGDHGALQPGREKQTLDDFGRVLVRIARADPTPLAAALACDVPAFNMTVWALGHSRSPHARKVLESLVEHEDSGVRSVATFHLQRHARAAKRGGRAKS